MLLRNEIGRQDIKDISVSSAGIDAVPGYPPDAKMVEYLTGQRIPFVDHASRPIRQADIDNADRILVMEKKQADEITWRWPQAANKVELLGRYVSADSAADDIVDPYGRSPYHYRLAQSQISLAMDNLVQNLKRVRKE